MGRYEHRWVVLHRADRAGPADPWFLITDVPAGTKRPEVIEALRASDFWPRWQARMSIVDATLVVRRHSREDEARTWPEGISWPDLTPDVKRVSMPVDPLLHARMRRAAASRDVSLVAWLTEAAHLQLEAEGVR